MIELCTTLLLTLYVVFALITTYASAKLALGLNAHYTARRAVSRMNAENLANEHLQVSRIFASQAKEWN